MATPVQSCNPITPSSVSNFDIPSVKFNNGTEWNSKSSYQIGEAIIIRCSTVNNTGFGYASRVCTTNGWDKSNRDCYDTLPVDVASIVGVVLCVGTFVFALIALFCMIKFFDDGSRDRTQRRQRSLPEIPGFKIQLKTVKNLFSDDDLKPKDEKSPDYTVVDLPLPKNVTLKALDDRPMCHRELTGSQYHKNKIPGDARKNLRHITIYPVNESKIPDFREYSPVEHQKLVDEEGPEATGLAAAITAIIYGKNPTLDKVEPKHSPEPAVRTAPGVEAEKSTIDSSEQN